MRNRSVTRQYYVEMLGFEEFGKNSYEEYLMLKKDNIQLHFFLFPLLDIAENYGQVYIRTNRIDQLYQLLIDQQVPIHPNGPLQTKPWGQKEFALLDPDNNLLTFGQSVG